MLLKAAGGPLVAVASLSLLPLCLAQAKDSSSKQYFNDAGLPACPERCGDTGNNPANWTLYTDVDKLLSCRVKAKVLDFSLHNPLEREGLKAIRACSYLSTEEIEAEVALLNLGIESNSTSLRRRAVLDNCPPSIEAEQEIKLFSSKLDSVRIIDGQALGAIEQLQARLLGEPVVCTDEGVATFAHYGDTVVGLWMGGQFENRLVGALLLQTFAREIYEKGMVGQMAIQLCGSNRNSGFTFGIMADVSPESALFNVQKAVLAWSKAECVSGFEEIRSLGNHSVWYTKPPRPSTSNQTEATSNVTIERRGSSHHHSHSQGHSRLHALHARADCRTTTVNAGDGCWAVAQRCGISQSDLEKFNGGGNFCSSLIPNQKVCCSSGTLPSSGPPPNADGTCSIMRVDSGDSCASLAAKCGIPGDTFTKYNAGSSLCSTLRVGQAVCCSSGKLPDLKPKQKPDGSCFDYEVKENDWCDSIASFHGLTLKDLQDFNKDTWGFSGCENLWVGVKLCLSKGSPPMPAPISNAMCGPQKPNTPAPSDRSLENLAKLNPCPLNVCCNNWGQCGTTAEFCEAPPKGTKVGTKPGCVSNCGMDIINNGQPPGQFSRIGYFEAWNKKRPCLHMDITQFDTNKYTHIHYAFIDITPDFKIDVSKNQDQWDKFLRLKGVKRIAAFGGWAQSTEPGTFWIFREGVKPENRLRLANNLAAFILQYNLEGIDIDWEYPAAPDIPGIPPADPIEGTHYLELLKLLRTRLGTRSLSIAAPASYWYLRGFPMQQMSTVIDYVVYMTYDLHGQWDYGNPWATPGCPAGNCLRSHINMTETMNALAMITKAGVPSHKIMVGVTSYGRSFQMTTPGCTGPMCTYTGAKSGAKPGKCTNEPSYLANAEITEIIAAGRGRTFRDNSESDILVYDDNQWVAYMSAEEKEKRVAKWRGLNFGGVSDWAVDLESYVTPPTTALPVEGEDWRKMNCEHPAIITTEQPGKIRWESIGADTAWKEFVEAWDNRKSKLEFARFMADYFKYSAENACHTITTTGDCKKFLCSDFENKEHTGPAASLIVNALGQVNSFMTANYNGIGEAKNNVNVALFKSTFSKAKTDDTLALYILTNLIALGFTAGLAPVFNNMMKNIPTTIKDNSKDISYAVISFGASTSKDVTSAFHADEDGNHASAIIKSFYEDITAKISDTSKAMFSGEKESISFLYSIIREGKMTPSCELNGDKCGDVPGTVPAIEMRKAWETALYGYLIPQMWKLEGVTPVVINTESRCTDIGVGTGFYGYIRSDHAEFARGCWQATLLYLVSPVGKAVIPGSFDRYQNNRWTPPPGLKSIHNGDWQGVKVDDMIFSAADWVFSKGSGNRNKGIDDPAYKAKENFELLWDVINKDESVVRTPGLVDIPMCDERSARNNWLLKANQRWYSWPCNQ